MLSIRNILEDTTVSSASISGSPPWYKSSLNNLVAETSPFELTVISLRVTKMLPFPGKCPDLIESLQPPKGSMPTRKLILAHLVMT